jgi:hypothetical protein
MIFCGECGFQMNDGVALCEKCGSKPGGGVAKREMGAFAPDAPLPSADLNGGMLTISRAPQLMGSLCTYKITVNGDDYGSIGVGQSKTINVPWQIADVEIACTTIMMKHQKVRLKIRLGDNPHIRFELEYGGRIVPSVTGAELL